MGIYCYTYDGLASHRHVRYDAIYLLCQNLLSSFLYLALSHRLLLSFYVPPSSAFSVLSTSDLLLLTAIPHI